MKPKSYILLLLAMLIGVAGAEAQNSNRLIIPDLTALAGSTIALPISMDNSSEIVAVEFDLQLPEGSTLDVDTKHLSNRAVDHEIRFKAKGGNTYHCLIYSPTNSALLGRAGQLMTVNMHISETYEEGSEHRIELSDVVLALRDGSNGFTDVQTGTLTMQKGPDLSVTNIMADATIYMPGTKAIVTWQVNNIGALATSAGWTEYLSIKNAAGVTKLLSTTQYDETLAANAVVSRQLEIVLPTILGMDGEVQLELEVQPHSGAGESQGLRWNNTGTTEVQMDKLLTLSLPTGAIDETYSRPIKCSLTRSGDRTTAETFNISAMEDSRLSIPASVTIPAGQSTVIFYIQLTDNTLLDENSIINATISGCNYPEVSGKIEIEDNEYPDLTITSSKYNVSEGETFQLSVTAGRAPQEDLTVSIVSEASGRFTFPAKVTIPAGTTSVTFDVTAVDDDVPSLTLSNSFTAYAPSYNKGEVIVILEDDDVPVLELTLTPNKVSEADGPIAVAATLRRTGVTNNKITVKLSDDSKGGIYYGTRTIELAKGVEEAHFNLGPIDNADVDGDRIVNITAAVYISSCSCNASGESAGVVASQLTILDDDGPALKLTSAISTLKEGDSTTLTISRNTSDNSSPLNVSLSSDQDSHLSYDKNVTLQAGQSSTTVNVTSLSNDVQGDSYTVIFTAQSDGFSSGTCFMMVTDQTLPDARVSSIKSDINESIVGTQVIFTISVSNYGAAELPEEINVKLYRRGDKNAVGAFYTNKPIAVGETLQMIHTITLPNIVGTAQYYAVVNEDSKVMELTFNNNTSEDVYINILSPFAAQLSTDQAVYKQGDTVKITGRLSGSEIGNATVDLYLINEGTRQVQSVTSDANGTFYYEWKLYALQSGHFSIGACYPNENVSEEMASFDVYGLKRTENSYITCDVINGDTYEGSISLINPGILPLSGVNAEILFAPESCNANLFVPSAINGGQTVTLKYQLEGTEPTAGNNWEEIKVRVSSNEGAFLDLTLYFYCRVAHGKLVASCKYLETSLTKGKKREYVLQLSNIGSGNTGNITLSLPNFIKSLSGNTLPSLNKNDTIDLSLALIATEDMELNVPIKGQFGINCENGEGTFVNFNITPVSDINGTLVVDVCDEYTYCTVEGPHLKGADVSILNPVTQAVIYQAKTDSDGRISVQLPEGRYTVLVTSDNHDSYKNTIIVDPERETIVNVNLCISTIKINYIVEPTEIEDEYRIVTTMTYETNVPAPVVVVEGPTSIDGENMQPGESVLVKLIMTNKGLVTALNVRFHVPAANNEWSIQLLDHNTPFDLGPQQSVVLPLVFTKQKKASSTRHRAPDPFMSACMAGFAYEYNKNCGKDIKNDEAIYRMALKTCAWGAIFQALTSGIGGGGGLGGPGGGGGGGNYTAESYREGDFISPMCDPEFTKCAEGVLDKLFEKYPGVGPYLDKVNQAANIAIDAANANQAARKVKQKANGGGQISPDNIGDLAANMAKDANDLKNLANGTETPGGKLLDIAGDLADLLESCFGYFKKYNNKKSAPNRIDRINAGDFDEVVNAYILQITMFDNILKEFFGDGIWYNEFSADKAALFEHLKDFNDWTEIDANQLSEWKPQSVTTSQYQALIERWSNTNSLNRINWVSIKEDIETIQSYEMDAMQMGYESVGDLFNIQIHDLFDNLNNSTSNVCSTVQLQFSQTMVLTRQAFRGTLTVFNGSESEQMKDVKLTLRVINKKGDLATSHEFQINPEFLKGFKGQLDLESGWTLESNTTGVATVLFIPTKYAAPTEPVEWSFGGSLNYIDPFTGLQVTRELYPVTLTVKPSPELDMTYFMQRDVYGDDPLTLDVVEPMKPAEFALLINNKGYGDATNVRMVTQQPEIIENEKGLFIDFELISSQVNGGDATLSFGQSIANDFGTIPSHSQIYAQWWLTSTLLGHFVDYKVEATHLTSYGNEELSLLDQVTIHELIHGFEMPEGNLVGGSEIGRAFLVNDIADANDLPDMLYFTNGDTASVAQSVTASIVRKSDTECELTITPSAVGWNYGSVLDPTHGYAVLKSIVRKSDGTELGNSRFWQTDRTLRDGKDWLYENRLHFVDDFANAGAQTYVLTFEPTPETVLEVSSIDGIPAENELAEEPVDIVTVNFSKVIDPETFTADDITMNVQAEKQDASQIGISSDDNKSFRLDLSAINAHSPNGYYTLAVQTSNITDAEGFNGKTGKHVGWIMFRGGLVQLLTSVYPLESGSIQRIYDNDVKAHRAPATDSDNSARYGSTVTLTATPVEGYEFTNWTLNGDVVSTEPTYSAQAISDLNIVANFKKRNYLASINSSEGGSISGSGTGYYEFQTELTLTAEPDEGYKFDGWDVDGELVSTNAQYTFTVSRATEVKALFSALYIIGDANGDGIVNLTDAAWIVRTFVGRKPTGFVDKAADVNGDGNINLSDARKVVGLFVGK